MSINIDTNKFNTTKTESVATVTTDAAMYGEGSELTMAVIKEVADYNTAYLDAVAEAASKEAVKIMSDDDKIQTVHFDLPFGTSKRGSVGVTAERSHTYKGMHGGDDVTKSTLKMVVKEPSLKVGKSRMKALQASMTESLID